MAKISEFSQFDKSREKLENRGNNVFESYIEL